MTTTRPVRRTPPRAANSPDHRATLARRLTPRDTWLLRMLHEHRVLTSTQITTCAFPSARSARQRLRELYLWSVLDRFQPATALGSAPMHYVLGPAGADVLAGEHGLETSDLGYQRNRTIAIAHHQRLAHTIGLNDWFTTLIGHRAAGHLTAWWSEARCARHFGDIVRPDAYGRWKAHDIETEFFLEYDRGTETTHRVATKLHDYAHLAEATGIITPLLIWFPSARREAAVRRSLAGTHHGLENPNLVPVATAAADLPAASPADAVWSPLSTSDTSRHSLDRLNACWPHIPPPGPLTDTAGTGRAALPPPNPVPPTTLEA